MIHITQHSKSYFKSLFKIFIFIIIIFLFLYGSFRHSSIVNLDKESYDQSAYIHYAKEFYFARHLNKDKIRAFCIKELKKKKMEYETIATYKQDDYINKLISEIDVEFDAISINEIKQVISVFLDFLQTKDAVLGDKEFKAIDILIASKSSFWGDALDGSRMPLYPLIQSFFFKTTMNDEFFFERGKVVNILLSVILLVIIALILFKKFTYLYALNLFLIITFTLFVFKAAFFQCELLFYFLNFVSFIFFLRCFQNLNVFNSCLTGFFAGLAYLTKASILSGLILFLLFLICKMIFEKKTRKRWVLVIILIVSFLIIVSPFIKENKNKFGSYFYNINFSYMWKDSWYQISQEKENSILSKKYSDNRNSERRNSISVSKGINRLISGLVFLWSKTMATYGYRKYIVCYFLAMIFVASLLQHYCLKIIKEHLFLIFFVISYFICYYLLYSWYVPVASGNRLILSIFLPFLYVLSLVINNKVASKRIKNFTKVKVILNGVLLFLIVIDIYVILTNRIITVYGGT